MPIRRQSTPVTPLHSRTRQIGQAPRQNTLWQARERTEYRDDLGWLRAVRNAAVPWARRRAAQGYGLGCLSLDGHGLASAPLYLRRVILGTDR